MRPLIETTLAALFLALGPFLYFFGFAGAVLFGLPLLPVPAELQDPAAIAALGIGCWLSIGVCAAYPEWREQLLMFTVALLLSEVALWMVL